MKEIVTWVVAVMVIDVFVGAIIFNMNSNDANRREQAKSIKSLSINNQKVNLIAVASTTESQEQGLSGLAELKDEEGLLFVFNKADKYGFWMKDMIFDIDIIWIDQDGEVISINNSVPVSSYPQIFYPDKPATYVLEMNAGSAQKMGIKKGDQVEF